MRRVAVILAGGSGNRLGSDRPKQFLPVAGRAVIEHTIDAFEHSEDIDEICIVCRADCVPEAEEIVRRNGYRKVSRVLCGGAERYDSSLAAIRAYTDDDTVLVFHDAVRPLVSARIIHDCVEAMTHYRAVGVAVPTTDTIIEVDEHECVVRTPDRTMLRNMQTPQCFLRGTIRRAYELALADPAFRTTDDCGVVRRYLPDEPVYIVRGESRNMKLTYAEDLTLIETLMRR